MLKTEEEALRAVQQDGLELDYVPENLRTEAVCLEAVKEEARALEYVPESLLTEDFCVEIVKSAFRVRPLAYIPESIQAKIKERLSVRD